MNFKLKAIAVSMLIVSSVSANAAMTKPTESSTSSYILTLIDTAHSTSAMFDLGPTFTSFDKSGSTTFDLTSTLTTSNYGAAWTALTSVSGYSASDVVWGVYAGSLIGGLSSQGLSSTFTADAITSWQDMTADTAASANTLMSGLIQDANGLTTHYGSTNGANFADGLSTGATSTAGYYAGNAYGFNGDLSSGNIMMSGFGNSMTLYTLVNGAGLFDNVSKTAYGVFNLTSTGSLSYVAAVPEADTTSMVLATVGLFGVIARRRNKKNV